VLALQLTAWHYSLRSSKQNLLWRVNLKTDAKKRHTIAILIDTKVGVAI